MATAPLTVELANPDATVRMAEDVSLALQPGDCLCLSGDLGAGKSTFARALIRAIADDPDLEAPSPTFTLVQAYQLRIPISHMDLYRLGSPEELDELGLDDALAEGAALVEWPEKAIDLLPEDRIMIRFDGIGDSRTVIITAAAPFIERLERSFSVRAFLERHYSEPVVRRHLQGDASSRTYETIRPQGRDPLILMNAPRKPDGPPVRDGLPYSQIAHLAEDVVPFVAIAGWLRSEGFAAPDILGQDLDQGFLLVENLGTEGVLDQDGKPDPERYGVAIDCLAALHARDLPGPIPIAGAELIMCRLTIPAPCRSKSSF